MVGSGCLTGAFSSDKREFSLLYTSLSITLPFSTAVTSMDSCWIHGISRESLAQDLLSGLRPEGQSSWKVLLEGSESIVDVCKCLNQYCPDGAMAWKRVVEERREERKREEKVESLELSYVSDTRMYSFSTVRECDSYHFSSA